MKTVYVSDGDTQYEDMWERRGFATTDDPRLADIINFTGGEDVTPMMYLEDNTHSQVHTPRDMYDIGLYTREAWRKPLFVGICRGGQFLNVMMGGEMVQHIDGHGLYGTHGLQVLDKTHQVTSTHHQEMIPNYGLNPTVYKADDGVVEVVAYRKEQVFCFQPHPEYFGADSTEALFFELLEKYYG